MLSPFVETIIRIRLYEYGRAYVPLIIKYQDRICELDCMIDTGFSGEIAVLVYRARELGLDENMMSRLERRAYMVISGPDRAYRIERLPTFRAHVAISLKPHVMLMLGEAECVVVGGIDRVTIGHGFLRRFFKRVAINFDSGVLELHL